MSGIFDSALEVWMPLWERFLGRVEPHLPEYLHWNELCWTFVYYLAEVRLYIHAKTRGLENWEVVTNTVMLCFAVFVCFEVLRKIVPFVFFNNQGFFKVVKKGFFKQIRRLPYFGRKIQDSIDKACEDIRTNVFKTKGQSYLKRLPLKGMPHEKVLDEIKRYKQICDKDSWEDGYVSGAVYASDDKLTNLMTEVYKEYTWANPLHADVFPDVRKMEAEVVSMCVQMFNGDEDCCGVMTAGGTESIVMAVKCYRELGKARGISCPEIVVPYSVHPAFDKACHYFNMKLTHVPVDKTTGKADVKAMKKAISKQTILLVGSVPSFPHGCVDPMEDLAKLAKRYNLYLHADCCLGGFLAPFMRKAGFEFPKFDFSIPEVSSISADMHKYGYTPKGASVVLYRNKKIRENQFFTQPDWSGGVYASPSLPGSRPGNVIATTWAAMMYHGEDGYVKSTKKIVLTAKSIGKRLEKIPGVKLLSSVDLSVVSFTSDVFDVYLMSEELAKRKWHLNPLQFPSGLHIAVTMRHTQPGVMDRFVKDTQEVAAMLMKNPINKAQGQGALYGLSQQIPDRSIITEIVREFLNTYYSVEVDGDNKTSRR